MQINEIRIKKGFTREQIASVLNISPTMLLDYEDGILKLDSDQIIILCNLFSCSSDELLGLKKIRLKKKNFNSVDESFKVYLNLRFNLFELLGAINYLDFYDEDVKQYGLDDNFTFVYQGMFKDYAISYIIIQSANFWLQKDKYDDDISISGLLDYLHSQYSEISEVRYKFYRTVAKNNQLFDRLKISRDKINAHITNFEPYKVMHDSRGYSLLNVCNFSREELIFFANTLADIMQEILDIYVAHGYEHGLRNLRELKVIQ